MAADRYEMRASRLRPNRSLHGQALVEFTLVLPILLVLLLAVADFGRVFAAGIVVQAASRDGAEAAAQQYVQLYRGGSTVDYAALHATAERVACAEAQRMLGTSLTTDGTGVTHCSVPAIAVCVHDSGTDPSCGSTLGQPTADEAAACGILTGSWTTQPHLDAAGLPSVEVRMCYPFLTLIPNQILSFGTIYLQESSSFVAVIY